MSRKPKPTLPCRDCGGPKSGRGARFCEPCRLRRLPLMQQAALERDRRRTEARRAVTLAADSQKRRYFHEAPDGQKWCPDCDQFRPVADFSVCPTKKSGYDAYCRACASLRNHARWLKKTYGISPEHYDELLEQQDGRCAICLRKPRTQRLAVDHDHRSGQIRGLLCYRCNRNVVGSARDLPDVLRRAANYLCRPPAVTGQPLHRLGHHLETLVESSLFDAQQIAEASGAPYFAAVIEQQDSGVGEAFVVMPLRVFTDLLAADQVEDGAA